MSKQFTDPEAYVEETTPLQHRTGVSAADSDPADATGAIDCVGYKQARVDIYLESGSLTSITVQALFWNSRTSVWTYGASRTFTSLPGAVDIDVRGGKLYMKVTAITGTNPVAGMDYLLS